MNNKLLEILDEFHSIYGHKIQEDLHEEYREFLAEKFVEYARSKEKTYKGGDDIFHSIIEVIPYATNDKNVIDKFPRLHDEDRLKVATLLVLGYVDVQKKINEIYQDYTGEEVTGEFKSENDIDKFFLEKYDV